MHFVSILTPSLIAEYTKNVCMICVCVKSLDFVVKSLFVLMLSFFHHKHYNGVLFGKIAFSIKTLFYLSFVGTSIIITIGCC